MNIFLLFLFPFTHEMNFFFFICIHRDWRGSNPQLPPWQGGALTNWTTIPWKKLYSILIITIQILSSFYILDSNRYAVTKRGELIYILISIWICTLVRSTRITSNPFVIAKSIEKWINEKKKTLFCLFTLILSLDFIVIDPADNNLSKSEFVEKNM